MLDQRDGFYDVLTALETIFNLEGEELLEDETICDTEQNLDNLTNFMLNFNSC